MSSVYSARLGVELRLGKKDASPIKPDAVLMKDLMGAIPAGALPKVPTSGWGWGYDYGSTGWGMDGNGPAGPDSKIPTSWAASTSGAGDCYWAMVAHKIRELAKNAGRPIPAISDLTVINTYAAYTAACSPPAYDPQTGDNDNGTDPQQAYDWMRSNPFKDDHGNAYPFDQVISLTAGSVEEHLAATWLFQNVGIGLQLQQAQMNQFDAGQPWAYVKGSPTVGGHEVLGAGPNGLISWSCREGYLPSLIVDCNDESQATLSNEMYNAVTGETVNDYRQQDLEKYVSAFASKALAA